MHNPLSQSSLSVHGSPKSFFGPESIGASSYIVTPPSSFPVTPGFPDAHATMNSTQITAETLIGGDLNTEA